MCYEKKLSRVDLPGGSHQHEIGVPKSAHSVFPSAHRWLPVTYHFFDIGKSCISEDLVGSCYYNTREGRNRLPEYRLYYPYSLEGRLRGFSVGDICTFLSDVDRIPHLIFRREDFIDAGSKGALPTRDAVDALSLPVEYRVMNISDLYSAGSESGGKKRKRWYWLKEPGGLMGLYKWQRSGTVEAAIEKICAELAHVLGLPVPITLFGQDDEANWGVLSISFVMPSPEESLESIRVAGRKTNRQARLASNADMPVLGSTVLSTSLPGYSEAKRLQNDYTIRNIMESLANFGLPPEEIKLLLRYFIFDSFIGNTDRHHDNWMVLQSAAGSVRPRIAPTFDHGPCLGGTCGDSRREELVKNSAGMLAFFRKGRSAIFGKDDYLRFGEVINECRSAEAWKYGQAESCDAILAEIAQVKDHQIEEILKRLPRNCCTELERDFFYSYLKAARDEIRRIKDSIPNLES